MSSLADLINLGTYTLSLNAMINDTNATVFGDKELPSYKLNFTVTGKKYHSNTMSHSHIYGPLCMH